MAKKKKELQQFEFEAVVVRHMLVLVEARDEKEARELAESGDWQDEQQQGMSDFEIRGRVR